MRVIFGLPDKVVLGVTLVVGRIRVRFGPSRDSWSAPAIPTTVERTPVIGADMASELDPIGAEVRAVLGGSDFRGARVLEVGSGGGRLTFRYAAHARSVVGIDPKEAEIAKAARSCPAELRKHVRFLCASATALPFRNQAFDIVLLASAL
jgi:2-polyprenyl-3-methyl-5-hydroxy-6-metoxy-1,4-benzoquinol methylase